MHNVHGLPARLMADDLSCSCAHVLYFLYSSDPYTFTFSMAQTKAKKAPSKRRTRSKKAGNSPAPSSQCTPKSVRYCGPTSHPSHHHAAVAASGSRHIWSASIIAGLAIVLTAAIAFTAVQAEEEQHDQIRSQQLRGDIVREMRSLNDRIDQLETKVEQLVR